MTQGVDLCLALFYCRRTPGGGEDERQLLERKYGGRVRFFALPCSGRLEPIHLLRALEQFADADYLIACPEGACRYFEGNHRARRRVQRAQAVIAQIGLEPERIGMVTRQASSEQTLARLTGRILTDMAALPPSPVLQRPARSEFNQESIK